MVSIGKKDGSWRQCVDYRELNKNMVRNKFLIPLVDDLLDELHKSSTCSKIDLRAGYTKVRTDSCDMHKTTFRTHGGHYKYIVMPSGLTNAPNTFQGLMNVVVQKFLRQFLLLVFVDILISLKPLQST